MNKTISLVLVVTVLLVAAVTLYMWPQISGNAPGKQPASSDAPNSNIDWNARMSELVSDDGVLLTFANKDIAAWTISEGHKIERFKLSETADGFGRLSSAAQFNEGDILSGLRAALPLAWAQQANGKRIEVGVLARQSQSNSASNFSFAYATMQMGNSGWRTFKLTPNFQVHKFRFDVPSIPEGYNTQPLIVLRSDRIGGNKSVEIAGVYAKLVTK